MKMIAYTALIFLILFTTVTLSVEVSTASESFGKAYGFPLVWHAKGVSSLTRVIFTPALVASICSYLLVSYFLALGLRRLLSTTLTSPFVSHGIIVILFLIAAVTLAFFLTNFMKVEATHSISSLGDSFSNRALHLGLNY